CGKRRQHHALVRLLTPTLDEVQSRADQHGTGAVQHRIERREERGAHLHQAAGLVVRRFATRNDSANITSVNSASTAKLPPSDRSVEAEPGKSSERSASVP